MALSKVHRAISESLGELPLGAKDSTFKPSGFQREVVEGELASSTDFLESESSAMAELKLLAKSSISVIDLGKLRSDSLTIIMDNGEKHVMSPAWTDGTPQVASDGTLSVVFHSPTSKQISRGV